jgi:hypothetical protein
MPLMVSTLRRRRDRKVTRPVHFRRNRLCFRKATSEIKNPDGSIVFRLETSTCPRSFRRSPPTSSGPEVFPQGRRRRAPEEGRGEPFRPGCGARCRRGRARRSCRRTSATAPKLDARQVFDRLAGTWTYWGWKGGYFTSEEDALAFRDELAYMLATQRVAPNSPQWFNTGLHWAYGIDGPGQGHFYVDPFTGKLTKSKSSYEHPQPHACFIQSSRTISSTKAASWTCGCAKPACSNTAPAPAPISPSCAAKAKAVGRRPLVRPDELPEDRRPRRRRHQVGRHHAPRGQDGRGRYRPPGYRGPTSTGR